MSAMCPRSLAMLCSCACSTDNVLMTDCLADIRGDRSYDAEH
jgi:hypothetical protein